MARLRRTRQSPRTFATEEDRLDHDTPNSPHAEHDPRVGQGKEKGGDDAKTLSLKPIKEGDKTFRVSNLQKETGVTPAKMRALLEKAGVPGPTDGKVWNFHADDRAAIVAIIKNGGKLPDGKEKVSIGKPNFAKIGSTPDKISEAVDKIPSGGKWSAKETSAMKDIAAGKASGIKSTLSSVPPPPPSMSEKALIATSIKTNGAVKAYTGSAYVAINNRLRGTKNSGDWDDNDDDGFGDGKKESVDKLIGDMDKAFAQVEEKGGLQGGVRVTRSMGYEDFVKAGYSLEEGAIIKDKGYMSTSIAERSGSLVMDIDIPAGSKAMYVAHFSNYKSEKELLLSRGTSLRIKSVTVTQSAHGKKTRVKAEVVDQD